MRPPCWRVRTLMVGVALSAATLGIAASIDRRGKSFRRLAAYHLQADGVLIDKAGGPLACGTGLTEADVERVFCDRGPRECLAFRAAMYHAALSEKYRLASERPWLPVVDDPPAPPTANPRFESDPLNYKLVAGDESATGFK